MVSKPSWLWLSRVYSHGAEAFVVVVVLLSPPSAEDVAFAASSQPSHNAHITAHHQPAPRARAQTHAHTKAQDGGARLTQRVLT